MSRKQSIKFWLVVFCLLRFFELEGTFVDRRQSQQNKNQHYQRSEVIKNQKPDVGLAIVHNLPFRLLCLEMLFVDSRKSHKKNEQRKLRPGGNRKQRAKLVLSQTHRRILLANESARSQEIVDNPNPETSIDKDGLSRPGMI